MVELDFLSKTLYVGIDESNHGRFPEYFVATFSQIEKDVIKGYFEKEREDHNLLLRKLSQRDYSFLLLEEDSLKRKKPTKNAGKFSLIHRIIPSLMYGCDFDLYNKIKVMVDGPLTPGKKEQTEESISEICGIERNKLMLDSGPKFDEKYFLVNLADEMAHYLFRHVPLKELVGDKHERVLVK